MNKRTILVVSASLTSDTFNAWANSNITNQVFVATDEEAIEKAVLQHFDAIVLDGTDETIDVKKLNAVIPLLQEEAVLITYKGETGLVFKQKVASLFNQKRNERIKQYLVLDATDFFSENVAFKFSAN